MSPEILQNEDIEWMQSGHMVARIIDDNKGCALAGELEHFVAINV